MLQDNATETAPTEEPTPDPVEAPVDAPDAQLAEPLPDAPPETPVDDASQSALDDLLPVEQIRTWVENAFDSIAGNMLTVGFGLQASLVIASLVPAALFGPRLKRLIEQLATAYAPTGMLRRAANAMAHIATPIAIYITWQICNIALKSAGMPTKLLTAALSLLTAWIVIRLVTLVIRSPFWSRVAFYVAWPIAALDAFGVLDNVTRQLPALSIPLSDDVNINALSVVRALIIFGLLFSIANFLSRFVEKRIEDIDELTPSLKAMLVKVLNILLPIVALLVALQVVGVNLATLTIFGGAVGLGIGLGLQRTVSNFVSGFALIADKSLKPGDVIEVGDTFGWVTAMGARYVTVRTRDGKEHLVPNDHFTNDGVVNWSHADRIVRLHVSLGVAYASDLKLVKSLCEEAARETERVLKTPSPVCNLVEFADSSVNFDLRLWINDPANGVTNVRSDVMFRIWDKLHAHGIEIPYPQRVVTLHGSDGKPVAIVEEAPSDPN